jgi:hypothetical protein
VTVSNPAKLSSVKAEFGGPNNLTAYYRGGPYVPSDASSTISTTAAGLKLSQFNGVTKPAALTASANPSSVSGSRTTGGTVNSTNSLCSAAGTSGTITYLWQYVSGDSSIACNTPSSASTVWSGSVGVANPSRSAVWRCKVTNSGNANVAYSNNVSITLTLAN